jgi:cystathionine beta-lyase/cystathionine gamma-synthase
MNGHSDAVMGLLCGRGDDGIRINKTVRCWGMTSSPFDCWICERGLMTLHVRVSAACKTAMAVANALVGNPAIRQVDYPGLESHADHAMAVQQFQHDGQSKFGHIVTMHLRGGMAAAGKLIGGLAEIPYCTSLGGAETTLSHSCSSSHRSCSQAELDAVGIDGGTIRLSIGLESPEYVLNSLEAALHRLD